MKLTIENVRGTEINWGQRAAPGVVAREAKSGAFLDKKIFSTISENVKNTDVRRVAILLIQDIKLATIPHPSSDPCRLPGCAMIGPTPWALTMHQMKKMIPAMGVTIALAVNKCRLGRC